MENQFAAATQPKRRIYDGRVLLLHILAVLTYFITIYYQNYTSIVEDKIKVQNEAFCFRFIFNTWIGFKSTSLSLIKAFDQEFHNKLLKKIFVKNIGVCLFFVIGHILMFRLMPCFYIDSGITLYHLFILFTFSYETINLFLLLTLSISCLSFIIHLIGNSEFDLYSMLLSEYSRMFLNNFILFASLLIFSFCYAGVVAYLFIFKTTNCHHGLVHIFLFLILIWILDWIISLIEVFTASVTILYLINRHSESRLSLVKEALENTYYCLGSVSIGKCYFYFFNTYNFMYGIINGEGLLFSTLLSILTGLPLAIMSDVFSFFIHSLRGYVLPYIAIYNVKYSKAVRKTNYLLFDRMYLRFFDNIYLKNIFFMILLLIFPTCSYIKNKSPLRTLSLDDIDGIRIVFFSAFMTYYLWNIFFSIFYTISTTMSYVVVLFPTLLQST